MFGTSAVQLQCSRLTESWWDSYDWHKKCVSSSSSLLYLLGHNWRLLVFFLTPPPLPVLEMCCVTSNCPPTSPSLPTILQQVCLSRSLLLSTTHRLLLFWCFNRWINNCFYFHFWLASARCLCAPHRRIFRGEKKISGRPRGRKREKGFWNTFGGGCSAVYLAVSWAVSQLNTFAYLGGWFFFSSCGKRPSVVVFPVVSLPL